MPPLLLGFQLVGYKQVLAGAGAAGARLQANLLAKMRLLVVEVAGRAVYYVRGSRATNPPHLLGRRTGSLAKHIGGFAKQEGSEIVGRVGVQGLKYGPVHELGAVIRARRKPFLAWENPPGEWHFAKQVKIPARPYLQPALADKRNRIAEELGGSFRGVLAPGRS